jgi:PAS domain S-box-containing protein
LAAIVESSDDAIVSKDLDGIVTSWNKAAERIFGFTTEEIVGQPITLIIPPELHKDEVLILSRIRAGERIDHFETIRLRKDGTLVEVSLTVSPIKDSDGKIVGAAKIARDITEQNRLKAALHVSERLASVGRLAATVAHEINNPLEAVTNFIYLAKLHQDLPEKTRRYLENADQELRRVAHIAQQTLGFYRGGNHAVKLVIADVVQDVLTIYQRKCHYKDISLERRIEPGLTSYGLPGELKQILSNLISNAIDASREGGKIMICARLWRHPNTRRRGIRFSIVDNGVGISAEDKKRIFTPFFTTKKDVGTGLGLWISRELLAKRSGYIRLRNQAKPPGTVVSFFVPDVPDPKSELAEAA